MALFRVRRALLSKITLIAIVFCGISYLYGKQSDNSSIGRLAIGAADCHLAGGLLSDR